jgi:nitrogen regulatory protein PII
MLKIIFRASLEEDVMRALKENGVTNFTLLPIVGGIGHTGKATGGIDSVGINSMLLVVLEEDKARDLASVFHKLYDHLAQQQHGARIPLHVFEFSCEKILYPIYNGTDI